MSGPDLEGGDGAPPSRSVADRIDAGFAAMYEEPMLRPLLFVLLAHVAAFLAPAILLGLRDANLFGLASLAVMLVGTGSGLVHDWRAGKLRVLTGFILGAWTLGGVFAGLGYRYGVL